MGVDLNSADLVNEIIDNIDRVKTLRETARSERDRLIQNVRDMDSQIAALERTFRMLRPEDAQEILGPPPAASFVESEGQLDDSVLPLVLEDLEIQQERLPFVGFRFFMNRRLPEMAGGRIDTEDAQNYMNDLIDAGYVEVHHVENPKNDRNPTASIRLTEHGTLTLRSSFEDDDNDEYRPTVSPDKEGWESDEQDS